jgi:membrane-associated protease RseP (regulator of RpoE activity)
VARGYKTGRATLGARGNQTELVVRIVLYAASPIAGEVRDDQGSPVSASVVACEDQPTEARVQSGADGTFELPASAIGCDAVAEDAEYSPSDAAKVVEGKGLLLRLKSGGGIQGVVVDDHGGTSAPFNVGIEAFVPARGKAAVRTNLHSFEDASGRFTWERLAPGTYVLSAAMAGRPPVRSDPIDVRAGVVTTGVRIVVPPGGSVAGHVYGVARVPVGGARIRFDAASSVIDSKASTVTDGAGQYRIDGAPAGPFTMRVEADGFRTKLVSGLRVTSGATLPVDVTMLPGSGMELGGIGAGLRQTLGGIAIGNTFAGDPAAAAGVREGDRIVSIDGEPAAGLSLADVLQRIRGEPGTSVGLSVERPSTGETLELTIVRGTIAH